MDLLFSQADEENQTQLLLYSKILGYRHDSGFDLAYHQRSFCF